MKPHYLVIAMSIALLQGCENMPPQAVSGQTAVSVRYSGVNMGVHYSSYPELVQIPGHPVYYDPQANANYFFYNRIYWVLQGNNWYSSGGYNGPWNRVDDYDVPSFVLRIPVRYYRQPPPYFRGWVADAPPRWGDHWGREWEQRRNGWDRGDRSTPPPPMPLPNTQRNYSGDRNPHAVEQPRDMRSESQRYTPRDNEAQKYAQPRMQQEPQRQQEQQRPQDPQRQQEQQRQRDQPRQPGSPGQQRHQEQQQQPQLGKEPSDRNNRQEEKEKWRKKKEEERDQGR